MTTLHGTNGNDTIREDRYDGEDIYTYGGDDFVILWVNDDFAGVRYVDTGDGNDWVEQSFNGHGQFNLGAGNDTFISEGDNTWLNEVNYVDGGAGNDSFIVDTHRSIYLGGAGDDSFRSTGWSNAFDGGDGRDFVSYDLADAAMTINLAAGSAQRGGIRTEAIVNVEGARGTAFNDFITGNNADNSLEGFSGNDLIDGSAGNDTLQGDAGSDTLIGGTGNDTLVGGAGPDSLNGGDGIDTSDYSQSASAVSVNLATGLGAGGDAQGDVLSAIERIIGSAFNDTLTGGTRIDILEGGAGNDTLIGGAGNDTIDGGAGTDTASYADRALAVTINPFINTAAVVGGEFDTILNIENFTGGNGNDTLLGTFGGNVIAGGGGNDLIYAFDGADLIDGGAGNDVIAAGIGNDTVAGGDGGDWLYGEDGNDQISGTAKSGGAFDVLIGGLGDDTLEGSAGGFDYFYGGVGVNGGTGDGNDSYIVRGNTGIKVMNDFEVGGTADVVRLLGTGLTNFAQVQAAMSFSGVINGTVLVVDGTTQIWFLNGTQPANLLAADFLFA